MSPIARLAVALALLAGATVGAICLGSSSSGVFLLGLSLMLLLPAVLASLIDLARERKNQGRFLHGKLRGAAISIPVGALAVCSLLVGGYFLAAVLFGSAQSSWTTVLAALIAGFIFLGFGLNLLRSIRARSRDEDSP